MDVDTSDSVSSCAGVVGRGGLALVKSVVVNVVESVATFVFFSVRRRGEV